MKKLLGVSILCVASAATAQSKMPPELFAKLAADWYVTDQCAFKGRIKPETAAYGKHLLRQSLDKYQADMAEFARLVEALRKRLNNGLSNTNICNTMAVEIEEIRLQVAAAEVKVQANDEQQRRDAQVKAQLEQQQRQEAQAQAQLEQRRRQEEALAARMEAHRQQQEREADAADKRREMEAITQQFNQIGKQFRDFGNSVQPRTTNCVRTIMGANCTSY